MKVLIYLAVCVVVAAGEAGLSVEAATAATVKVTEAQEPYLLVADNRGILRINMDGSNRQQFVRDQSIVAIDYHYKRDLLFWVTKFSPDLKFTTLSNKTGNITSLYIKDIKRPTGVAVDWLNDRVYWVENPTRIRVYDLNTKQISDVITINRPSIPKKLKILPHLGLLYLGDQERTGIYSIPVSGEGEQKEVLSDVLCPYTMTLNYKTGNIYAMDTCSQVFKSSRIDGSNNRVIFDNSLHGFVLGSSMFEDKLFWTQSTTVSSVKYLDMNGSSTSEEVLLQTRGIYNDLVVVHPSNQPSASELQQYGLCELVCHHGDCTQSGLCSCKEGWTGSDCTIDIDECQEDNGGCEKTCVNSPGTFRCHCEDGEDLLPDQKGCKPAEPTLPTSTASSSTAPSSTAPSSTAPSSTTSSSTTPSSTTPSSTPPTTTPPPPMTSTHAPTTQTIPLSTAEVPPSTTETATTYPRTTPPSSTEPSTTHTMEMPSTTTETVTTPHSTTETVTTPHITTDTVTTPHSTTDTVTTATTLSSTGTDTTSHSNHHSTTDPANILHDDNKNSTDQTTNDLSLNENGLKSKEAMNQETLIITVVTSAVAGFVISVVATLYAVYLYIRCRYRKTGSYNVYERHHRGEGERDRVRRQSDYEAGTTSVHSSFRDITEEYDNHNGRGQVLADVEYAGAMRDVGVAELGCAGAMRDVNERPTLVRNVPILGSRRERGDAARRLVFAVNPRFIDNCHTL